MSDIKKAFALLNEAMTKFSTGLATLEEALDAAPTTSEEADETPATPAKKTRAKKGTAKKGTAKKGKAKKTGPTIDDARAKALELIELFEEYGDDDDDANQTLVELIQGVDEDEDAISAFEDDSEKLSALIDSITKYIDDNFEIEED